MPPKKIRVEPTCFDGAIQFDPNNDYWNVSDLINLTSDTNEYWKVEKNKKKYKKITNKPRIKRDPLISKSKNKGDHSRNGSIEDMLLDSNDSLSSMDTMYFQREESSNFSIGVTSSSNTINHVALIDNAALDLVTMYDSTDDGAYHLGSDLMLDSSFDLTHDMHSIQDSGNTTHKNGRSNSLVSDGIDGINGHLHIDDVLVDPFNDNLGEFNHFEGNNCSRNVTETRESSGLANFTSDSILTGDCLDINNNINDQQNNTEETVNIVTNGQSHENINGTTVVADSTLNRDEFVAEETTEIRNKHDYSNSVVNEDLTNIDSTNNASDSSPTISLNQTNNVISEKVRESDVEVFVDDSLEVEGVGNNIINEEISKQKDNPPELEEDTSNKCDDGILERENYEQEIVNIEKRKAVVAEEELTAAQKATDVNKNARDIDEANDLGQNQANKAIIQSDKVDIGENLSNGNASITESQLNNHVESSQFTITNPLLNDSVDDNVDQIIEGNVPDAVEDNDENVEDVEYSEKGLDISTINSEQTDHDDSIDVIDDTKDFQGVVDSSSSQLVVPASSSSSSGMTPSEIFDQITRKIVMNKEDQIQAVREAQELELKLKLILNRNSQSKAIVIQPNIVNSPEIVNEHVVVENSESYDKIEDLSASPQSSSGLISVLIDNLMRPLSRRAFRHWLEDLCECTIADGNVWFNSNKSYCYVDFSTSEEANRCIDRLTGLCYPEDSNVELDFALSSVTAKQAANDYPKHNSRTSKSKRHHRHSGSESRDRDTRRSKHKRKEITSEHGIESNHNISQADNEPVEILRLDDLFRKTVAGPSLYWLPVTDEEATLAMIRLNEIKQRMT